MHIEREERIERERERERDRDRDRERERERYIYIYAVKLKTGPRFALFKVKNWSNVFLFFLFFLFLKISFSLQNEEDF